MKLPAGYYVIKQDKEKVLSRIDILSQLFFAKKDGKQVVVKYNECRNRFISLLDDCFEESFARNRCQKQIKQLTTDNIDRACQYCSSLWSVLFSLRGIIPHFIPFDDLPSCRSLLDYSVEDAARKALDLVDNGIVKGIARTVSIGTELYHIVNIVDVKSYYTDSLKVIEEYKRDGDQQSPVDLLFENKCRLELEYCKLAALKVSGKLSKEILEASQSAIDEYSRNFYNHHETHH